MEEKIIFFIAVSFLSQYCVQKNIVYELVLKKKKIIMQLRKHIASYCSVELATQVTIGGPGYRLVCYSNYLRALNYVQKNYQQIILLAICRLGIFLKSKKTIKGKNSGPSLSASRYKVLLKVELG